MELVGFSVYVVRFKLQVSLKEYFVPQMLSSRLVLTESPERAEQLVTESLNGPIEIYSCIKRKVVDGIVNSIIFSPFETKNYYLYGVDMSYYYYQKLIEFQNYTPGECVLVSPDPEELMDAIIDKYRIDKSKLTEEDEKKIFYVMLDGFGAIDIIDPAIILTPFALAQ